MVAFAPSRFPRMPTNNHKPVTSVDLRRELRNYPTKADLKAAIAKCASKKDLDAAIAKCASKKDLEDLRAEVAQCATKKDLENLRAEVAQCASKAALEIVARQVAQNTLDIEEIKTCLQSTATKDDVNAVKLAVDDLRSLVVQWRQERNGSPP